MPPEAGESILVDGAATEKTDTEWSLTLAVASSPPDGLNATEYGLLPLPVENGEPVTGVSAPPGPTENTNTELSL